MNNIIYSSNIGILSGNYCQFLYSNSANNPIINTVQKFKVTDITLGDTVNVVYTDPTLSFSEYIDNKEIILNVNISGCSGIYSKLAISDAWNDSLNGIEIDTLNRSDINFFLGGTKSYYLSHLSTTQDGYWAEGGKVVVSLTDSSNNNILYDGTYQTLNPTIWHYDTTGIFNILLGLKLKLDTTDSPVPFSHPDFSLTGCKLNVKFYDKNLILKDQKSYVFNIDPPNGNASISVVGSRKVIDTFSFDMYRDSDYNSSNYTEIHNIRKNIKNINENLLQDGTIYNFKNNNLAYYNFIVGIDQINRGGYSYISYEPLLRGIKPIINGSIAYSDYVTNCKGHKFRINNTTMSVYSNGSFGSDILDQVTNQNPYVYINTENSGIIKVVTDIEHENWNQNQPRDLYDQTDIYPYITTVYVIAALNNVIDSYLTPFKSTFLSYDQYETYPNIEISLSDFLSLLNISDVVSALETLSGTDIELTSQENNITIVKSGNYKIFYAVKDEFNQISMWCITNKVKNYNIPF